MVSIRARLVMASLRAHRSKRFYADPQTMRARLARHQDPRKTEPPRFVRRTVRVATECVDGIRCHLLFGESPTAAPRMLYLHGGGFVEEPQPHHWRFLRWMAERNGIDVVFPVYPLCPAAGHRRIRASIVAAHRTYLAGHPGPAYVFGDSAGGALAVHLTATLRARGARLPDALGLLSPWLDLALRDPRSERIDPDDPELGIAGLRQAGRWYAAGDPLDAPKISPVHEDPAGFPRTLICTGTRDLLNPDAHRFRDAARDAGVPVELHEQTGMFHNWTMQRIPEGARARERIARFLG